MFSESLEDDRSEVCEDVSNTIEVRKDGEVFSSEVSDSFDGASFIVVGISLDFELISVVAVTVPANSVTCPIPEDIVLEICVSRLLLLSVMLMF